MYAKTQVYQGLIIKIIGIDMSSAFDTINRRSLMDVLEEILDEARNFDLIGLVGT